MNTVDVLGEYETYKRLVEGTLESFEDDRITSPTYSSISGKNITSIILPNATEMKTTSFDRCPNLETLILPLLVSPNPNGVDFDSTKMKLETVNFHSLNAYLRSECFDECALKNVDLYSYKKLDSNETFRRCRSLKEIVFPSVTIVSGSKIFEECTSLRRVDFHSLETISGTNMFISASQNVSLIIRTTSMVVTLSKTNPWYYDPSSIYVPDSLVDSYKEATNWSTYANKIKPLSELPAEEEET